MSVSDILNFHSSGSLIASDDIQFNIDTKLIETDMLRLESDILNTLNIGVMSGLTSDQTYQLLLPATVGTIGQALVLTDVDTGELQWGNIAALYDSIITLTGADGVTVSTGTFSLNQPGDQSIVVTLDDALHTHTTPVGTYGSATTIPVSTVNIKGQVTDIVDTTVDVAALISALLSPVSFNSGINVGTLALSIDATGNISSHTDVQIDIGTSANRIDNLFVRNIGSSSHDLEIAATTLAFGGSAQIWCDGGTLTITAGTTSMSGHAAIGGDASVTGTFSASTSATIGTSLDVGSALTVGTTLVVGTTSQFSGNITLASDDTVSFGTSTNKLANLHTNRIGDSSYNLNIDSNTLVFSNNSMLDIGSNELTVASSEMFVTGNLSVRAGTVGDLLRVSGTSVNVDGDLSVVSAISAETIKYVMKVPAVASATGTQLSSESFQNVGAGSLSTDNYFLPSPPVIGTIIYLNNSDNSSGSFTLKANNDGGSQYKVNDKSDILISHHDLVKCVCVSSSTSGTRTNWIAFGVDKAGAVVAY